jgi:hypothetical protein
MATFQKLGLATARSTLAPASRIATFTPACASFAPNSAPETPDLTMITSASISAMAMRQA